MSLTIKFKDRRVVAHEVVFSDDLERNLNNCFRFALKAFLYYKDRSLHEFAVESSYAANTVARNLCAGKSASKVIKQQIAVEACEYFGTKFEYLVLVAEQFSRNPEYNSITFKEDGTVIFFKAFKFGYGGKY